MNQSSVDTLFGEGFTDQLQEEGLYWDVREILGRCPHKEHRRSNPNTIEPRDWNRMEKKRRFYSGKF